MPCALFALLADNPEAVGGGIAGSLVAILLFVIPYVTKALEARRRAREVAKIPPIEVSQQVLNPAPLLPPLTSTAELRLRHLEELEVQRVIMHKRDWEQEHEITRRGERIAELERSLIRERAEAARNQSRAERLERRVDQLQRALDDATGRLRERGDGEPETRPTTPQGRRRG